MLEVTKSKKTTKYEFFKALNFDIILFATILFSCKSMYNYAKYNCLNKKEAIMNFQRRRWENCFD